MQELDSQLGKQRKEKDHKMIKAILSITSEHNGALHCAELANHFER
jgi:hypothetical protein